VFEGFEFPHHKKIPRRICPGFDKLHWKLTISIGCAVKLLHPGTPIINDIPRSLGVRQWYPDFEPTRPSLSLPFWEGKMRSSPLTILNPNNAMKTNHSNLANIYAVIAHATDGN